ncbi:MAG: KH domain-containing protein, partial [Eubacteriales bacterium]|nr:KH domain-containing protein [Eubacteriales bacterium]
MKITIEIDTKINEKNNLIINLKGEDIGIIIGKRGQTLDSLQYLVNLIINKGEFAYMSVSIDTEDYRERRKQALENLAINLSKKVKKINKSVNLEPMNPYERRIIHSKLQNDKNVRTYSEGEEPFRYVVIAPKQFDK